MSILHLSGFQPFSNLEGFGLTQNPSGELMEYLENTPGLKDRLATLAQVDEVVTHLIGIPEDPNFEDFQRRCREDLEKVLSQMNWDDRLISSGQGRAQQKGPVVEGVARNILEGRGSSCIIDPRLPRDHLLDQREQLKPLVSAVQASHPEVTMGDDAGTFVCDFWLRGAAGVPRLFIHFPYCTNIKVARAIWTLNEAKFKREGITSPEQLCAPTVEKNYAFLETVATLWRP